jgi:hypothetical protein
MVTIADVDADASLTQDGQETMRTVQTVDDLRRAVRALRADGLRLALVPTMGRCTRATCP